MHFSVEVSSMVIFSNSCFSFPFEMLLWWASTWCFETYRRSWMRWPKRRGRELKAPVKISRWNQALLLISLWFHQPLSLDKKKECCSSCYFECFTSQVPEDSIPNSFETLKGSSLRQYVWQQRNLQQFFRGPTKQKENWEDWKEGCWRPEPGFHFLGPGEGGKFDFPGVFRGWRVLTRPHHRGWGHR